MLLKSFRKIIYSLGFTYFFIFGCYSYAQTAVSGTLKENNLQIEFCAMHAACAISVGIMEGVNQGLAASERIKSFFANHGRQPAKSIAEFNEWLTTLTPSERQAMVKQCTDYKGSYMLDWCQESFLTPSEFEASRPKVKVESDASLRFSANQKIKELQRQDDEIMKVLRVSCRMEATGPNYGCTSQSDLIHFLYGSELRFNQDLDNKRLGFKFESNSAKFYAQFFDWDPRKEQWVTKQMPPQDDPWKNLPQRASGNSPLDKQLASAVNSNTARSGSNPFEGTSADLDPAAIEAQRERYQRNQDLLLGVAAQVMATTAQAMELANQQRLQQQRDAQQRAEPITNNQRIYSDDPQKEYIPPTPGEQRAYSDTTIKTNVSDNNQSANYGSNRVNDSSMSQCVVFKLKPKSNNSDISQRFDFINNCQTDVMVHWSMQGTNQPCCGGSTAPLSPGQIYDSYFLSAKGGITYWACRARSATGAKVHLDRGGCYWYRQNN